MAVAGEVFVRDCSSRLPGGFWVAAGVWLEKPHVLNRRLCGCLLGAEGALPPADGAGSAALAAAWSALRQAGPLPPFLGAWLGPPRPAALRTLLPKARAAAGAAPRTELVLKVTLIPNPRVIQDLLPPGKHPPWLPDPLAGILSAGPSLETWGSDAPEFHCMAAGMGNTWWGRGMPP